MLLGFLLRFPLVTLEAILLRLTQMEQEYALDACHKPSGTEAFHFGRACGRVQGFAKAREEIARMIEEDAKNEQLREMKE